MSRNGIVLSHSPFPSQINFSAVDPLRLRDEHMLIVRVHGILDLSDFHIQNFHGADMPPVVTRDCARTQPGVRDRAFARAWGPHRLPGPLPFLPPPHSD